MASYDHWEPCQWDEVVNENMLARNPDDLADMVRRSVVEWGVAPPSYVKGQATSEEEIRRDFRCVQSDLFFDIYLSIYLSIYIYCMYYIFVYMQYTCVGI